MSLSTFDTLLAFATMMLVLSMFVTAFVQFCSAALQLRSNNLVWGLERLFDQLDPKDELGAHARALAEAIVKDHRLISGATLTLKEGGKLAQWASGRKVLKRTAMLLDKGSHAIKAGELVSTLRELAQPANPGGLPAELHNWLKGLVADQAAGDLLGQVDAVAAEVMHLMPGQSRLVHDTLHRAVLSSDALAHCVSRWFDAAMDRTAERFALHCRYLTMLGAAVVVGLLQVDALWLFHQLSNNPQQRTELLAQVETLAKLAPAAAQAGCGGNGASALTGEQEKARIQACIDKAAAELTAARQRAEQALSPLIKAAPGGANASALHGALGFLLSWALLSLGAPFWFNLLKSMSSLRPLLASRVDAGKV